MFSRVKQILCGGLFALAIPTLAWSAPLTATVIGPDATYQGAVDIQYNQPYELAPRDVVVITRDGQQVGQGVVVRNLDGATAVVMPTGGDLEAGDMAIFAQHGGAVTQQQNPIVPPVYATAPDQEYPADNYSPGYDYPGAYYEYGGYPYYYGPGYGGGVYFNIGGGRGGYYGNYGNYGNRGNYYNNGAGRVGPNNYGGTRYSPSTRVAPQSTNVIHTWSGGSNTQMRSSPSYSHGSSGGFHSSGGSRGGGGGSHGRR